MSHSESPFPAALDALADEMGRDVAGAAAT